MRMEVEGRGLCGVALTGVITHVEGLECEFTVNQATLENQEIPSLYPNCEYVAILSTNVAGRVQLVEYSGTGRILKLVNGSSGVPTQLQAHFSLPGKVRPLRRHPRQNCANWQDVIPGLALSTNDIHNRPQLLSFMKKYFRQKKRSALSLINISPGGVCLRTDDAIARKLMNASDRYLFFFFLKSPLEEKIPWVFLGRKAGAFRIADSMDNGLRIQFMQELQWQNSVNDLCWSNIAALGSDNLQRMLEQSPQLNVEDTSADSQDDEDKGEEEDNSK